MKGVELIEAALTEALALDEDTEDGDLIGSWVAIAYIPNPSRTSESAYFTWHAGGEQPDHVARGLLHTALARLNDE